MIQPSPTGTKTLSGMLKESWLAISSDTVFLPSIVKGLYPVFLLYHPNFLVASIERSNASS